MKKQEWAEEDSKKRHFRRLGPKFRPAQNTGGHLVEVGGRGCKLLSRLNEEES